MDSEDPRPWGDEMIIALLFKKDVLHHEENWSKPNAYKKSPAWVFHHLVKRSRTLIEMSMARCGGPANSINCDDLLPGCRQSAFALLRVRVECVAAAHAAHAAQQRKFNDDERNASSAAAASIYKSACVNTLDCFPSTIDPHCYSPTHTKNTFPY